MNLVKSCTFPLVAVIPPDVVVVIAAVDVELNIGVLYSKDITDKSVADLANSLPLKGIINFLK